MTYLTPAGDRWQTVLAIDHDKWAAETYRANFPGVDVVTGSVADQLYRLPAADVVLGGPPCQPHSLAGKREASADARDGGADFVAAVAKVGPRMFLMENVPGLLTSEGGGYAHRLLAALEAAGRGYVVQIKTLDAVNYGVPQFRSRCWWWGIRSDVYAAGVRHGWPLPTHAWPPPLPSMFGGELLAGVTVGEALGLDGYLKRDRVYGFVERGGERRDFPTAEPAPTLTADNHGGAGCRLAIQMETGSKTRKDGDGVPRGPLVKDIDNPGFAVDSRGFDLRVFGSGRNHPADADGNYRRDKRDITNEQSTTIVDCNGATTPTIHADATEYRWSDAYRAKHPPASPASSVVGQWHKGLPNGALIVAENWKRKGDLWVRRLAPLECARLQSVPVGFIWPDDMPKTHAYRVVGNGWACGMAAHMSRALATADLDSRTVVDLFCGGGLGAAGWHGRFWSYAGSGVAA